MNDMDFNYNERPKNALQQAQLDKIRENINDIINNIDVEDGIIVTNSESRASADVNYIEVYNEKTDESKTIRVANHYKAGVSEEADYNIYIDEFDDMNKLNIAIEDTIDKAMQSINTPEQEDLSTDDMVLEPQKNYNVEKSQQSLYNQERGGISGKEQRKTKNTLSGNKNESKSDRRDIGDVQYRKITNEGDIEHRDFSRNWNADNRRKNITYNSERKESGKQRKLIDDAVIEKAFKDVINKYGRTTEYKSAGYLLPDGTMINLTDKATGRRVPHADVRFTGLDELDFIYSGAIRLFPEFGYWSMTENPTQEQLDILEEYIDKYVHESLKLPAGFEEHDTFVDVYTKNGKIETLQISQYENGRTAIKQLKVFLNSIKKNSKQSSFLMSKTDNADILKSKESNVTNLPEAEKLLDDKEYIHKKVESKLEDAFRFKLGNEDADIHRKFKSQLTPIIKEKATRIDQLIKLDALTKDTLDSIINEIFNQEIGITKNEITTTKLTKKERELLKKQNTTVKEYIESVYDKDKITEISNELEETIQKVDENLEKSFSEIDKDLVKKAKENVISLMRGLKYSDDTINGFLKGYANDYEKGMYSQVLDAFLYYSRPLERIEANNYEGIKKTNYLIEKRKWDLQHSGKIEQSGYKNGVNWRGLRTTIEQHLGKEIRLKGFKQKAYGIYKPTIDEIRIKNISDIDTALHELGHRFDFKEIKRAVEDTKVNEELMSLCQRAFKDAYKDDPVTELQEGWAEFTRRFICDNEKTLKEYPATSEFFVNELDNSKRLQKTVTELIDMVETYVHSNSNTATSSMISVGEDTTKKLILKDRFDKFVEDFFDDYWALKNVSKAIAKAKGTKYYKEDPTQNPYYNKRLNKESEERIKDIIKRGFVDDNGVRVTKGLTEILKPFEKSAKKITDIRNLLWARRSIDYLAKDLSSGLGVTDAINVITSIKDENVLNAVQEIEEFANYPFELAYKRGMLTETQYEEIKKWNKFYVPVKRVFEDQINLAKGKNGKIIKARTGSERDIIDFMETITQNTAFMIDKVAQNEGLQILAKNADLEGVSNYYSIIDLPQKLTATVSLDIFKSALQEQLGKQTVNDLDIDFDVVSKLFSPKLKDDATKTLTFMQDGKMKAIQFYNDSLYKIYSNANNTNILEALKIFDKATGILRAGATALNVEFALPNMISDTFVAWIYSENGFIPIVDTVRGIFDYVIAEYDMGKKDTQNKLLYSYYQQSGTSMSTRVASFRPEVQEFIENVIGKYATEIYSDDPKAVKNVFKKILKEAKKLPNGVQDFLSIIPEVSEQATRFSYFKKSYNKYIKKGWNHRRAMLQAGIETKDATVDFNRAGKITRVTNRLKAFSNAVLQGFYKGLEGMAKHPVKAPAKILFLVATSTLIQKMFGEDKRLEEVSKQTKKDNYVFMIGDIIVKIKKPQDVFTKSALNVYELVGIILSGDEEAISKSFRNYAEDIINDITSYNVDFDKTALDNIISIALQTFTAVEPLAELRGDKDFYFDSQITPYGTEDNSPQYQYDEYTSEMAKLLGEKLKQSPAQIEHLITSYGAGVGKRLLEISNKLIDIASDDVTLPDETSSDKFIINRFVVDENKNSQSVSDVYEIYDKLNTKKKDEEFTGVGLSQKEQEQFDKLTQAKETFSRISKKKRIVQNTLSLNGTQKRKKLDELNSLRTDVARYYLGKDLINKKHKEQIELYEWYPASEIYKYTAKNGMKYDVTYNEDDKKEYATLWKKYYEEAIAKERKKGSYKNATKEEKEDIENKIKSKTRNQAQNEVTEKAYRRKNGNK